MTDFIPIEFQKAFEKTRQTAVTIQAHYTENPSRLSSQFGGKPYWEKGVAIPLDGDSQPLALLAQINFAELPATEKPIKDLPQNGILQFFIPKNADNYGADLDQFGSCGQLFTQWWENPSEDKLCPWDSEPNEEDLVPVFGSHVLQFKYKDDYADINTIECANALNANPFEVLEDVALNEKEESAFYHAITHFTQSSGHKLLGYPHFIGEEPREDDEYRLLLQIDTDLSDDNDIIWGEEGIAQLFIRHEDLIARNFEKTYFYWDC